MTDAEGRTCLMLASAFGRHNAISALFGAESLDPDVADSKGFTALHFAVQYNLPLCLRVLLDGGASVDCTDKEGNTPLMLACIGGHRRCTSLLLEREASVNAANTTNLKTALHLASQHGHTDCVDILMDFGADAKMTDSGGLTAEELSKSSQIIEIIQLKSPGKPIAPKPGEIAEIASPSKAVSIRD
jgi:ankyrin repeat protein